MTTRFNLSVFSPVIETSNCCCCCGLSWRYWCDQKTLFPWRRWSCGFHGVNDTQTPERKFFFCSSGFFLCVTGWGRGYRDHGHSVPVRGTTSLFVTGCYSNTAGTAMENVEKVGHRDEVKPDDEDWSFVNHQRCVGLRWVLSTCLMFVMEQDWPAGTSEGTSVAFSTSHDASWCLCWWVLCRTPDPGSAGSSVVLNVTEYWSTLRYSTVLLHFIEL